MAHKTQARFGSALAQRQGGTPCRCVQCEDVTPQPLPRYRGDVPDPRGGVRWVIPEKAKYWG